MEVVFSNDGREVVFWDALSGGRHRLEFGEAFWVVHAFFKKIEFRLTYSHLTVKSEEAFSCIIESFKTHWLKGEVIRMASEKVECFGLGLFWLSSIHVDWVPLVFESEDLLSAFIEVNVREDEVLNAWQVVHSVEVEVNFHSPIVRWWVSNLGSVVSLTGSGNPCL